MHLPVFRGCCKGQYSVLTHSGEGVNGPDMGLIQSQCSGFVKHNRINLCEQLQRTSVFDKNSVLGGFVQKIQHANGSSQAHVDKKIRIKQCNESLQSHKGGSEQRKSQSRRNRGVCNFLSHRFNGICEICCFFQYFRNFCRRGFRSRLFHLNIKSAGYHNSGCKNPISDLFFHRMGFACEHMLIRRTHSPDNDAVCRHRFSRADHKGITGLNGGKRNFHFHIIFENPHRNRLLSEYAHQTLSGFFLCNHTEFGCSEISQTNGSGTEIISVTHREEDSQGVHYGYPFYVFLSENGIESAFENGNAGIQQHKSADNAQRTVNQ